MHQQPPALKKTPRILVALPEELAKIAPLQELDVSCNKLQSLPLSLRCLTNLTKVNLSQNPWSGQYDTPSLLMTQYSIAGRSCIRAAYNALQILKKTDQHPKLCRKLKDLYRKATYGDLSYAAIPALLATNIKVDDALRTATSRHTLRASKPNNPTIETLLVLRVHLEFMRWFMTLLHDKELHCTNPLDTQQTPKDVKWYLWQFASSPSR